MPIKRISAHSRREKSIRHGHISTLHIWWARRPLAACRAVICAALWPDPADELCPQAFIDKARELMLRWSKDHLVETICSESQNRFVSYQNDPDKLNDNIELRMALLDFIADFSAWKSSTNQAYLKTARALTQSAHEALGGVPGTRPLVVDPFAGGGAIPLEALRVGADAFASDLNPVAVLLNKVVLEYIPKYGKSLAEEVRKWGQWVKEQAEKELSQFYPNDEDGATPMAYLWARTITCEAPGCGATVPLIRSLWLAKKKNKSVAVQMIPRPEGKRVDFEIIEKRDNGKWYKQNTKKIVDRPKFDGTVARGSATCPCCGYTTPVKSVRKQLKKRHGGATDAMLWTVVTTKDNVQGRFYRLPTQADVDVVRAAEEELNNRIKNHKGELSLIPDESTVDYCSFVNRGGIYGLSSWKDYYNSRQLLTHSSLSKFVKDLTSEFQNTEKGEAIKTLLALAVSRHVDINSSFSAWHNTRELVNHVFAKQAISMVWDFCEANTFSSASGNFLGGIRWIVSVIEKTSDSGLTVGHACQCSATSHSLPNDSAVGMITDPPYYYSVQYADLADYFYVWLRRILQDTHPTLFSPSVIEKSDEIIVQSPAHINAPNGKNRSHYESKMMQAMAEGRRVVSPDGFGIVVFAHTSTAGWETQLQAMVDAGWIITASWPIDTEMATRVISQGRSVLASSIHLACRPRENEDGSVRMDDIGDWREVLGELPGRIKDWMARLSEEGVVGADAIFACLGPALEIFSRYSKVEKANGEQVALREYLEQVWAAVSNEALEQVFKGANTSGFEEDSRLTAMWLWTLGAGGNGNGKEESKTVAGTGYTLEFDAARKIAQGLGAHLEQLDKLIEVKGDKARLLPVSERAEYLFGKDKDFDMPRGRKKKKQPTLFDHLEDVVEEDGSININGHKVDKLSAGQTTLDRVHQSMLLFAAGRSEAVRRFLVDEGIGADSRFWTLAQALSALYPSNTEEKRWVDGVLARKKGLGF